MIITKFLTVTVLLPLLALIGCSTDRVLLMTKTNIGIDVDNKPPTAEITIARREVAIQPTFPVNYQAKNNNELTATAESSSDELSLPLLASFGLEGNILSPRITGHFAGGDAAYFLAKEKVNDGEKVDNTICLMTEPADSRNWLRKLVTPTEEYKKEARQFFFATDTSYGLKVAWSGTAGPYPDSLKLGYNRKEFASPPVFVNKGCTGNKEGWTVQLPSFYASTDNGSGWDKNEKFIGFDGKLKHIQFFATGSAATEFVKRASVKLTAFENMAPDAAKMESKFLNSALIKDIQNAFNNADAHKKDKVLKKSIELALVPNDTTVENLMEKLLAQTDSVNFSVSTKLNQLRMEAQETERGA